MQTLHQSRCGSGDMILTKSGIAPEVTQLAQQVKDGHGPQMTTMTGFLGLPRSEAHRPGWVAARAPCPAMSLRSDTANR